MRIVLPLVALSLMIIAGCTTEPKASSPAGPLPAKDTHFVPPPKSLTQRATPSKEPSLSESVAADAAKPTAAQ
ncbi:hypothetical protein LJR231_004554 [Phyllobacterium sp. LjRoot231]|uniref:hypothetical protein n=1 Tax=Phyllobacterium sp. LjRoot231 TaxID=3342289 RepID=UPI003ECCFFFC